MEAHGIGRARRGQLEHMGRVCEIVFGLTTHSRTTARTRSGAGIESLALALRGSLDGAQDLLSPGALLGRGHNDVLSTPFP